MTVWQLALYTYLAACLAASVGVVGFAVLAGIIDWWDERTNT